MSIYVLNRVSSVGMYVLYIWYEHHEAGFYQKANILFM